ncbi:MAG: shikimate dehydrogenase [Candidatus Accumulibacter sp.]|jgi:shikimate dehydrogenase|nr:shikimate dehydrogenase [Accumulibacter sp.]
MTDKYCVFGNPIGHSKSPQIQAAFARQTGQDIEYRAILAPVDGFANAVEAFIAEGGKGANVTLPFKQEACRLATRLSLRAEQAGAVNTLAFQDGEIVGDNTDGVGLLRDITITLDYPVRGKRVLLLGAGGAARGVVAPLLGEQPASLTIANRTEARAHSLAEHFAALGPVSGCACGELAGRQFDIVVDATSAGLRDAMTPLPPGLFAPGSLVYLMMYGLGDAPLRVFAREQGAGMISEGLGMLLEQAAESFFVWRGVRPDCAPVAELLLKKA